MKITFKLSILIKTVQKILIGKMSRIGTTCKREMVGSVPKSGQPMFRYCTKIWPSYGQALVSIYKHNKTLINNTNKAKLENEKKQANFLKFFIKFFKKWKITNRYKFYGIKVFKTEKAVDQNLDKFRMALTRRSTSFLEILAFKNYLLLFLIELFPDDYALNCSCEFSISILTFHSTTFA